MEIQASFPEEFIETGLKLVGRQGNLDGIRFDLLFEDRNRGKLLVEIQRGALKRDKVAQVLEYYAQLKKIEERPIDLMIIANNIPQHKRDVLDDFSIEYKEIAERRFYEIAKKNNFKLDSEDFENSKSAEISDHTDTGIAPDIHQSDEHTTDMDSIRLREQLNNLYSKDKSILKDTRSFLHNHFAQMFKRYSTQHDNVAHYGKSNLQVYEGKMWAFGAYWKRFGDSNALVLLRLPAPPASAYDVLISFQCGCVQGTNEKVDSLWKIAMPGIKRLLQIYPNIQISDRGKSIKRAMLIYDSNKYNTSKIIAREFDDLIQTQARFFDTVDPYIRGSG